MTALSDDALRQLIRSNPDAGWRAFIDQYTPLLVGLLRRAGLDDRDEVMDVYVLICEQLSAEGCERLKSHDGARGSIGGWLAVVARNAVVDWIRSRKGRRRLFHAVKGLSRMDQRVFELYYWDERTLTEMSEILSQETGTAAVIARICSPSPCDRRPRSQSTRPTPQTASPMRAPIRRCRRASRS